MGDAIIAFVPMFAVMAYAIYKLVRQQSVIRGLNSSCVDAAVREMKLVSARDEARERAAVSERQMLAMQSNWAELLQRYGGDSLRDAVHDAIMDVQREMPRVMIYTHKPDLVLTQSSEVKSELIDLVRFSINFALYPGTPPEYVANHFAEQIRMAILTKWREQSMLLKGKS